MHHADPTSRATVHVPLPPSLVAGLRVHYPAPGEPAAPVLAFPNDPMRGLYQRLWACVDGELLGVCDGECIHLWTDEWSGSPPRSLPLAGNGLDAALADLKEPRLIPIAGVGAGRLLLLLKGYDVDRKFVTRPLVCDPAGTPAFRVLTPRDGDTITGTEPKHVVVGGGGALAWLTGDYDAGAAMHLDEFIAVKTAHRLDLASGTFARATGIEARAPAPPRLYTAGLFESGVGGRLAMYHWDLPGVRTVDGALEISVRPRGEPVRGVAVVPLARPVADTKRVRDLVAAVADGQRLLVIDATGDALTVHHRTLTPPDAAT